MGRNRSGISWPARLLEWPLISYGALMAAGCGASSTPIPMDVRWSPFFWATVAVDGSHFPRASIVLADPRGSAAVSESMLQLDLAGSGTWPLGFRGTSENDLAGADD